MLWNNGACQERKAGLAGRNEPNSASARLYDNEHMTINLQVGRAMGVEREQGQQKDSAL